MAHSYEKEYKTLIDGATGPTTSSWEAAWYFQDASFHIIGMGEQSIVRLYASNEAKPSKDRAAQIGQDVIKDDIVVMLESCRMVAAELVQNPDGNPITVIYGGRR